MEELPLRERVMVQLAGTTGLRRSELIALTWQDVDSDSLQIAVDKSCVHGRIGETKTASSAKPVPLHPGVAQVLQEWRRVTGFKAPTDFLVPSVQRNGFVPVWPDTLLRNYRLAYVPAFPGNETGQYGYLVEACDPCEDNSYAYTINGIAVSDFITPHFYDPVMTSGTRYSFGGNIKAPRQILPGGYISFVDPIKDEWEQILWVDHSKPPELTVLGPAPKDKSLREWIDSMAPSKSATAAARKKQNDQSEGTPQVLREANQGSRCCRRGQGEVL